MKLTIDLNYDQVFELARQLSPEEKKLLAQKLEETESKPTELEQKMSKEEFHEFLMNFPVVSEEEIQLMLDAKEMIDQCQPISL